MSMEHVFVAGAGLMGHGIGQVHAAVGKRVTLYEPDLGRARAGRDRIAGNLDRAVAKGRLMAEERAAILERVAATDALEGVDDADLVVEAVFEDIDVKTALWREIDALAPGRAIFASNTSSISIDRLAAALAPSRRAAFVGMHFFSPVPVMPLIELIRGAATDDATEAAIRAGRRFGKQVIVPADRPASSSTGSSCRCWPRRCVLSRRASGRPTTSTPAPRSASTTRWARSSSPTSSASTSAWASDVLHEGSARALPAATGARGAGRRRPPRPEDGPRLPHLPALTSLAYPAPMTWPLTEEERLLQATVREFACDVVAPGAAERDEAERFDRSIFERMAALGLTGAPFAEAVGGAGISYIGWTLVMERSRRSTWRPRSRSRSTSSASSWSVTWAPTEQRGPLAAGDAGRQALGAFA
jgi:hypothetical protein